MTKIDNVLNLFKKASTEELVQTFKKYEDFSLLAQNIMEALDHVVAEYAQDPDMRGPEMGNGKYLQLLTDQKDSIKDALSAVMEPLLFIKEDIYEIL